MCAVHDRSMCAIVSNGAIACVRPSATWTADRPPSVRKSSTFLIAKGFQGQSRVRDTPMSTRGFCHGCRVGGWRLHPSFHRLDGGPTVRCTLLVDYFHCEGVSAPISSAVALQFQVLTGSNCHGPRVRPLRGHIWSRPSAASPISRPTDRPFHATRRDLPLRGGFTSNRAGRHPQLSGPHMNSAYKMTDFFRRHSQRKSRE